MLAHPRLDLYAAADSKHSLEEVGCTGCHDGSGHETDFVLAAHTARPIWVDAKSGMPVIVEQILAPPAAHNGTNDHGHAEDLSDMQQVVLADVKSLHIGHAPTTQPTTAPATRPTKSHDNGHTAPKPHANGGNVAYLDPLTGDERGAVSQYDFWAKKYELEVGHVVRHRSTTCGTGRCARREYIEANCARCHTNIHDIKDEAPVLYEGRMLFAKMGCANCHQMDSIAADEPEPDAESQS